MRRVLLTVGPQCAGKSTYCQKVVAAHPEIVLISRDAILNELYGTPWLDKYTGGHLVGLELMWKRVAECLQKNSTTVILDTWNNHEYDRREITAKLRSLGAEIIEAWHFATPRKICLKWWFKREQPDFGQHKDKWKKICLQSHIHSYYDHYKYCQSQPVSLDQGFDSIKQINPLTEKCLET